MEPILSKPLQPFRYRCLSCNVLAHEEAIQGRKIYVLIPGWYVYTLQHPRIPYNNYLPRSVILIIFVSTNLIMHFAFSAFIMLYRIRYEVGLATFSHGEMGLVRITCALRLRDLYCFAAL